MEWQNLGIATLKHAICATNVFLKLPENQTTTNFIYLPSSNFVIDWLEYAELKGDV